MRGFLIDANLPYRFNLWHGEGYEHVFDHDDAWSDTQVWDYARNNDLVIVTKDTDFSDWIMLTQPPPRVIHLRIGNMKLQVLHQFLQRVWPHITELANTHKLVIVREHQIECME